MHIAQPVERGFARYKTRFVTIEIPEAFHSLRRAWQRRAGRLLARRQIELWSENGVGREKLLESGLAMAAQNRWFVRVDPGWSRHDVRFYGDRWCKTDLVTVTEHHGGHRMLTRVRLTPAATFFQKVLWAGLAYAVLFAYCAWHPAALAAAPAALGLLLYVRHSGRRLNAVVVASILHVAEQLGMTVVGAPDAFKRPLEEPRGSHSPLPVAGAARTMTTMSVSPILARAAGLAMGSQIVAQ
jgi:hypothetical protein